ncbi:DUF354 domain-containing protein [Mariniflexile litorale]|uniref:DUF354 domain-containing protein n=1 Tax=Mariniflexile litorale TaxID=3045158 RepID=A0AAU7EHJ7_9FLAO|nr:DUF354 domain-containing protein [Mariniflexile sp. KMM 9835]MDQ8209916.1 DUF354 domain-containing protein [Mariniflexile sp. KMM 9835]
MNYKILIDIKHPAQLNLFKGLALELKNKGWTVLICYLDRGKLPAIIKREYIDFELISVGSSQGTKWSIFWDGNVKRASKFIHLIQKHKFNICIAASSAPLALACKLTKTPIIQFYDDPERKRINKINAFLSDRLFFPEIVEKNRKIDTFNCLKEWSYLSPKRFSPNVKALHNYGLKPYGYVFVREVSNKSFNYFNQEDAIICCFSEQISKKLPIILSLEDKNIQTKFPRNWIPLVEPVDDIHSLMYYSKLVISSGDSMAREGAMLGVPSIYTGIREMKANKILINQGVLKHLPGDTAVPRINYIIEASNDLELQLKFRENLVNEWDDMVDFMEQKIIEFKK